MHSCSQRDDSFQRSAYKSSTKRTWRSAQRETKTVKCAYASIKSKTILCTLCTNKNLGFTFNTYTPIVIPWITLHHYTVIIGWQRAYTIKSYYDKKSWLGRVSVYPSIKVFLRCCLSSTFFKSQDSPDCSLESCANGKKDQSALPLCCTIGMTVTTRLLSWTAGR